MKNCIHQKKYCKDKILCQKTGSIHTRCNRKICKHFQPTLRYSLRRLLKGIKNNG